MSHFEDETMLLPRPSRRCYVDTARRTLSSPLCVLDKEANDTERCESEDIGCIIWPWNGYYQAWFYLTAVDATLTIFWAPWQIAFQEVH